MSFEEKYKENIEELEKCDEKNTDFFNLKGESHLAKVVKCYDGDTMHCIFYHDGKYQKFNVRMYGYDTAEMRPSRSLPDKVRKAEKSKALSAKKRLQELVLNKVVIVECLGFGKYGRLLANVKINESDDKTVNQLMIDEGHGKEYYGGTKK